MANRMVVLPEDVYHNLTKPNVLRDSLESRLLEVSDELAKHLNAYGIPEGRKYIYVNQDTKRLLSLLRKRREQGGTDTKLLEAALTDSVKKALGFGSVDNNEHDKEDESRDKPTRTPRARSPPAPPLPPRRPQHGYKPNLATLNEDSGDNGAMQRNDIDDQSFPVETVDVVKSRTVVKRAPESEASSPEKKARIRPVIVKRPTKITHPRSKTLKLKRTGSALAKLDPSYVATKSDTLEKYKKEFLNQVPASLPDYEDVINEGGEEPFEYPYQGTTQKRIRRVKREQGRDHGRVNLPYATKGGISYIPKNHRLALYQNSSNGQKGEGVRPSRSHKKKEIRAKPVSFKPTLWTIRN